MTKRPKLKTQSTYEKPEGGDGRSGEGKQPSRFEKVLQINHATGNWKFEASDLGTDKIKMSLLAIQQHRQLWSHDYDPQLPGVIVCKSADGWTGYGLGRRPQEDEGDDDWKTQLASHNCRTCPSSQWKEVRRGGKKKNIKPLCVPEYLALVLFKTSDAGSKIQPAVWEVKGTACTPLRYAMGQAEVDATSRLQQRYEFHYEVELENKGKFSVPRWSTTDLDWTEEEIEQAVELVDEANEFWENRIGSMWNQMRYVGVGKSEEIDKDKLPTLAEVKGLDDGGEDSKPVDLDNIPF